MQSTDVLVIGAGQAGLALSHCLSARGIEHLLLERGQTAERWRSERWDSLRLLTPNWQTRLPGFAYRGPNPDGFMSMPQTIAFLEAYAASFGAPVQTQTRVRSVAAGGGGYRVSTDRGEFEAGQVVIATGYCDVPARPRCAGQLAARVYQRVPTAYRNPGQLPPGGVLVVGASASGVQLADELARSGRRVHLAVGRHTRVPRRYRGADLMKWLDACGVLAETASELSDAGVPRSRPSLQLIGSEPPRDLDLATLRAAGVTLHGRLTGALGTRVWFADDLESSTRHADEKLGRLLERIDRAIASRVGAATLPPPEWPAPVRIPAAGPRSIDLQREGISSVLWATGFRRDYSWLHVPSALAQGELVHTRGLTPAEGLYALGLSFQHTRRSTFIDGVGADADYVARAIAARLGVRESFAA